MLGLSLTQIIFTVVVFVAVWRGFRMVEQWRDRIADPPARRPAKRRSKPEAPPADAPPGESSRVQRPDGSTVDLVPCPRCGAYVPNGTICRSIEECVYKT